ncbi:hypothetical protein PDR31_06680 [Bacillus cereus]|uniref:Group-specific protein n=1 Tax=Bacillus cereus TaxID=1396 RepID=A0AAW4R1F2_BACCE|nr:hypothetical protein [Bacillus cereus]MBY0039485.1 hypothetical protein [Bacillus cereus]MDA2046943.1 hypothetical protein [Bacillus cereus]MDA2579234.1 hypothetical protein [Bacillus cereus]MDA2635441.1 hypothetical protein [Bacillus cereus]MDC7726445.1 hypothetical protein [Bacillus cereus]
MGTEMKINRYKGTVRDSSSPVLIEKSEQILVQNGQNQYLSMNMEYNKFDIRTIHVTNDKDIESIISIFDKKQNGLQIYKSNQEKKTYDILAIPCEDKDTTSAAHVFIENKGNEPALFTIIIKAVSLQ